MAIAIDPNRTFDYVLESDRELDDSQQTTWALKALTLADETKIGDLQVISSGDGSLAFRGGTVQVEVLKAGLRGVTNFKDAGGDDIPYHEQAGRPTNKFLDQIAPADRTELARAIQSGSAELTESESD